MYFKKYNHCIFCGSKKLIKEKKQTFRMNFYLKAIMSDLDLSKKDFKKINVYRCNRCSILQNNPWFTEKISRKIYSNIYGQHNRSWSNLISFFTKGKFPDHGNLFNLLYKNIKIKSYCEYNSPFMGLFMNFFSKEYKNNLKFYKSLFNSTLSYLSSRQVAGASKNFRNQSVKKSQNLLKLIKKLKRENLIKNKVQKNLLVDNSSLCWGQNDNYKSVNSKTLSSELFDLNNFEINNKIEIKRFELFGIFHTLDHTFQPSKILQFALKKSDYVIVYCHVDEKIERQHLFTITNQFLNYLQKKKIYTLDLTHKIGKVFKVPEMYFLCSKRKYKIQEIRQKMLD